MTEANDTVMNKELQKTYGIEKPQHIAALEWQAEITWKARQPEIDDAFKAGIEEAQNRLHSPEVLALAEKALKEERQKGIKEVVECVKSYSGKDGITIVRTSHPQTDWWKSKLKEWEVDKGVRQAEQ